MRNVGVVAVVLLAGCGSEQDAEPFDSVAKQQAVITSVSTDDGFTQFRQNASVSLVIRGKKLGETTSVSVGSLATVLESVSSHEVRVIVFGETTAPLGPTDVTVRSMQGTTLAPGAIELTPFVVSPTAVTGHGTFQSPMNLCDRDLERAFNSVVLLLAGTHRCGQTIILASGAKVSGDPDHTTVVTGTDTGGFGILAGSGNITTIRDLTFAEPLAEWSISFDNGQLSGELDVERVIDAGGIFGRNGLVKLDHYTYEGEGTAVSVAALAITNSVVHHCGSGDGIVVMGASPLDRFTMDSVIVEDCQGGVVVAGPSLRGAATSTQISNSQLIDNTVGIQLRHTTATITDTVIRDDESTPRASLAGIALQSGNALITGMEITGQDNIGIGIFSPFDEQSAGLAANGLVITGGRVGIGISGTDNSLSVRNSIVRDQTVAALSVNNVDGRTDLGTASDPGNNQLSVLSGFTIDDSRFTETPGRYIRAVGTTLNGISFDGQIIDGPAELAPYYRFVFNGAGIEF